MDNLKALGQPSKLPNSPEDAELERVPNPHPDTNFVARFYAARIYLFVPCNSAT